MLSPIKAHELDALAGIRHGFFTREGGVSAGLYTSLNCGFGSNDDKGAVAENRARVARHLGAMQACITTPYQVHSPDAVIVEKSIGQGDLPRADALITGTPGLAIGVLTADCTPVLFADAQAGVVAAAHAGWRGAVSGILEATVARMEEIGARRSRIVAAVGPCIHQDSYEVGDEFEANLLALDAANERFFARASGELRPRFDLPGYVVRRLTACELGAIGIASPCTYTNESKFFSYRRATHRSEADYGRQISAILVT